MWKVIPGTDEKYSANDETGEIKSNDRRGTDGRRLVGTVLKPFVINSGYEVVYPRIDGKTERCLVHRLIAKTFLSNYDKTLDVNHIDGNKRNNVLSNLEMVTRSENIKHSIRIGLTRFDTPAQVLTKHRLGEMLRQKYAKTVAQIDPVTNEIIRIFSSVTEAANYHSLSPSTIGLAARGVNNTAAGFKWKYINTTEM